MDRTEEILDRLTRIEKLVADPRRDSPWLDISAASAFVGCGKTKMRELVDEGSIPAANIGLDGCRRSLRIHRRDLDRWMKFGSKRRLTKSEREELREMD